MHPAMTQELARIKISEQLQYAERERRVRAAGSNRPHAIDSAAIGDRVRRTLLRLGHGFRGAQAGAGA